MLYIDSFQLLKANICCFNRSGLEESLNWACFARDSGRKMSLGVFLGYSLRMFGLEKWQGSGCAASGSSVGVLLWLGADLWLTTPPLPVPLLLLLFLHRFLLISLSGFSSSSFFFFLFPVPFFCFLVLFFLLIITTFYNFVVLFLFFLTIICSPFFLFTFLRLFIVSLFVLLFFSWCDHCSLSPFLLFSLSNPFLLLFVAFF